MIVVSATEIFKRQDNIKVVLMNLMHLLVNVLLNVSTFKTIAFLNISAFQ